MPSHTEHSHPSVLFLPPLSLSYLKERTKRCLIDGTIIPFKQRDDGGEGRVTQFYQNGGLYCFVFLSYKTLIIVYLFMPATTYEKKRKLLCGS